MSGLKVQVELALDAIFMHDGVQCGPHSRNVKDKNVPTDRTSN